MSWQPSATLETLRARALILARIREFFVKRKVLEVETPLLSHATVTDPHVIGIPAIFKSHKEQIVYLQTSPEYAMKRLLAAGSGPIFQLGKAFRQGDIGQKHNPEFTMLEWYRPGFDHHDLMNEMDDFLQTILDVPPAERFTYAEVFQKYVGVDPHLATVRELADCAHQNGIEFLGDLDRNAWLDLLMTHCVELKIGQQRPVFLFDFPVSLAALAKIRQEMPPVASRFEVYFKGIELANGFHELLDADEQRSRFEQDLKFRDKNQLPIVPIDELFLAALKHGLPDCAGVALGVDRLVMLVLGYEKIEQVLSFDFNRS